MDAVREIFGGDLRDVSLSSLLQLARAEAVSGWIRFQPEGEVGLQSGRVISARCASLSGSDALRELLFRDHGRFVVIRGQPQVVDHIEDVTHVVMDAYRLRDEWARIANLALRCPPSRPWRPTGGPVDSVVAELDGQRPLADIVAAGQPVVTPVVDALITALNAGQLERVRAVPTHQPQSWPPPTPPAIPTSRAAVTVPSLPMRTPAPLSAPSPAPPPPDHPPVAHIPVHPPTPESFYELMDRARSHVRSEDYAAAEAALRRALELRPGDRVARQNLRALTRRRGVCDEPDA